jgi:hypothetical protein
MLLAADVTRNHNWLAMTASMRASFSYYDLAPIMGIVVKQLLANRNHYERLAEVLPILSKLQLVSDVQSPCPNPSRQPSSDQSWSLLSLPAQHICQTTHQSRKFPQVVRPLPLSIMIHRRAGDLHHASLIVPLIDFDFTNDNNNTVCDITTVFA